MNSAVAAANFERATDFWGQHLEINWTRKTMTYWTTKINGFEFQYWPCRGSYHYNGNRGQLGPEEILDLLRAELAIRDGHHVDNSNRERAGRRVRDLPHSHRPLHRKES